IIGQKIAVEQGQIGIRPNLPRTADPPEMLVRIHYARSPHALTSCRPVLVIPIISEPCFSYRHNNSHSMIGRVATVERGRV
ncbi:hypothetical protein, partial [Sphingobium sp.]|uniref:hypothetical protein n=1 Tax=Sphingobium sp. TaxID=1912891 RepID=UPI00257E4A99